MDGACGADELRTRRIPGSAARSTRGAQPRRVRAHLTETGRPRTHCEKSHFSPLLERLSPAYSHLRSQLRSAVGSTWSAASAHPATPAGRRTSWVAVGNPDRACRYRPCSRPRRTLAGLDGGIVVERGKREYARRTVDEVSADACSRPRVAAPSAPGSSVSVRPSEMAGRIADPTAPRPAPADQQAAPGSESARKLELCPSSSDAGRWNFCP